MRKLTEGNKTRFAVFAVIVIIIIVVLTLFLFKTLTYEKEVYEIEKQNAIYDAKYEFIDLTQDATIEKKWTGKYYLTEQETGLTYELGDTAIAYDSIKNRLNLYGTFYEVALDGEVTKTTRHTEVKDMLIPKLYKIEDRKYLLVADKIQNETGTIEAEKYLIVVLDRAGNTLLLNNQMDVKTINAMVLKNDLFTFDVANEKLLYANTIVDLKKIIGSTNEYIEPEKELEVAKEDEEGEGKKEDEEGTQAVARTDANVANAGNVQNANSYTSTVVNQGGATSVNIGSVTQPTGSSTLNPQNPSTIDDNGTSSGSTGTNGNNQGSNNSNNNNSDNNNNNGNNNNNYNNNNGNSQTKNITKIVKSVSLRGVTPGQTYLDVEYSIVDPENEYQVVYLEINGGGTVDNISLDKSQTQYRIPGLKQNTEYTISMGYKEINKDATIKEVTEDIINVKTLKLEGLLTITKVTEKAIYYNLRIDPNSSYDNAKIAVLVNGNKTDKTIKVNTTAALREGGWSSSIAIDEDMVGKVTLKLEDVKDLELTSSTQIY